MNSSCPGGLRMATAVATILMALGVPALAGPEVTLTLLDGSTHQGELQSLSGEKVDITTAAGVETISADQLMQVELPALTGEPAEPVPVGAGLVDQSNVLLGGFESDGTQASLTVPGLAPWNVPVRQLTDVRLAPLDDKVAASWEDLRHRNARDDLLVIRKGDVLDYVAGSIGKVSATAVTILVREKELSAPREKVFGLVYAAREAAPQARRVAVRTVSGTVIQVESLALEGDRLRLSSSSLGKVELPLDQIESLDYGGGRIRFLADLPFDQSASKAPSANDPVVWFVCRNAPSGSGGKLPLTIGNKEFRKGLWLHSGAVVRFRLNREYRQLRASVGFDLTHVTRMPRFDPRVKLVVLGDGRELYSHEFLWSDPPESLDVNLSDVRELTLRVDSAGAAQGILEHFALGDAQVIQ